MRLSTIPTRLDAPRQQTLDYVEMERKGETYFHDQSLYPLLIDKTKVQQSLRFISGQFTPRHNPTLFQPVSISP